MKRKTLISIALVMIMLLNCILPLVSVNAEENDGIRLNSKLYSAIKNDLIAKGYKLQYDDLNHTIYIEDNIKSSIKELNLSGSALTDITGLENFTGLEMVELSGNNLTKDSNLSVLNQLPNLKHVDLSTNQIEDVSSISSLIDKLKQSGEIVLSSQTVKVVNSYRVKGGENSDNKQETEFTVPQILELAGYIKSCWKSEERYSEAEEPVKSNVATPYVLSFPARVTPEDNKVVVSISNGTSNSYKGLCKFKVEIVDTPTEAASSSNQNKASENILNGSVFEFYFIINSSNTDVISIPDTNLYYAIKNQLTGGQTINKDLSSYKYSTDYNGDTIFEEYTYETQANGIQILTNVKTSEKEYYYNPKTNTLSVYTESGSSAVVRKEVYKYEEKVVDDNGNITISERYRIGFSDDNTGKSLYVAAYDDAQAFVIKTNDLVNKITSLILNNKQIRDLTGIEKFVGLTSSLNVSHNYLNKIEPIYALKSEKQNGEQNIINEYLYWLEKREYGNLKDTMSYVDLRMDLVNDSKKEIGSVNRKIYDLIDEIKLLDTSSDSFSDQVAAKLEEIKNLSDSIKLENNTITNAIGEINGEINDIYIYLSNLYQVYNNEYKLTSLLADSLNYQTYDEYKVYEDKTTGKNATNESAKNLLQDEINYLIKLEENNALSQLDKDLLKSVFSGIKFNNSSVEYPVREYFENYLNENLIDRIRVVNILSCFRTISMFSEMANYCLTNRIYRWYEGVPADYCYEEEYLAKRISELKENDLSYDCEEEIFEYITGEKDLLGYYPYLSVLYPIYEAYRDYEADIENKTIEKVSNCAGKYYRVERLKAELSNSNLNTISDLIDSLSLEDNTKTELKKLASTWTNEVVIFEEVLGSKVNSNEKPLIFNQLISISNKLLNGNTSKYIMLPKLNRLDISYNADLEELEKISELKDLKELNASYCYIADITNIDWSQLSDLRKLNLSNNFISNISVITKCTKLKDIDLSNNLINGELSVDLVKLENLKNLNLSYNQITDISEILNYLDYITNGNYSNYLASSSTLNMNLNNQTINLVIEEPISLEDYPTTVNIELPKIFAQLLAIDTERTAFGETSQNGRIEAEGKYVTLNTRTAGDKTGNVVVIAMSGDGTDVNTCVGKGTKAIINYKVVEYNTPNEPENPQNPDIPDNPNIPDIPDVPDNPENPENPKDPESEDILINTSELGYKVIMEDFLCVSPKTPIEDFERILVNGKEYNVVVKEEQDGNDELQVVENGKMKTGMYVELQDENGKTLKTEKGDLAVYQIYVKGDVNGDGVANSTDSKMIKAARVQAISLIDVEVLAADLNESGKVDNTDSKLLLYHRAEVNGYNLNFTK